MHAAMEMYTYFVQFMKCVGCKHLLPEFINVVYQHYLSHFLELGLEQFNVFSFVCLPLVSVCLASQMFMCLLAVIVTHNIITHDRMHCRFLANLLFIV